jgi:hypothetical protein
MFSGYAGARAWSVQSVALQDIFNLLPFDLSTFVPQTKTFLMPQRISFYELQAYPTTSFCPSLHQR